jgi:hypothetical protein
LAFSKSDSDPITGQTWGSCLILQTENGPPTLIHVDDGRKSLFGMLERAIPVVKDADAVPQLGVLLGSAEELDRLLIACVCFGEIVDHEIAVPERGPRFAVGIADMQRASKILGRQGVLLLLAQDGGGGDERIGVVRVMAEGCVV